VTTARRMTQSGALPPSGVGSAIKSESALPPAIRSRSTTTALQAARSVTGASAITAWPEFSAQLRTALQTPDGTGKNVGAVLARTSPSLYHQLSDSSDPNIAFLQRLLTYPPDLFPAFVQTPEAEKVGLGFYRALNTADAGTRGALFLGLLCKGVFGLPSHPGASQVADGVQVAVQAVRLFNESLDAYLTQSLKIDNAAKLFEQIAVFLRTVVLPLSTAAPQTAGNPLGEATLMESVAQTCGKGLMKEHLAKAPDASRVKTWGRLLAVMLRAVEQGPQHIVFSTEQHDDVRAVLYHQLLAMIAGWPAKVGAVMAYPMTVAPEDGLARVQEGVFETSAGRKMAQIVAPALRRAVYKAVPATPDGIVFAGAGGEFLGHWYGAYAERMLANPKDAGKYAAAFKAGLAS
jgi:hypothetical protein